MNSFAATDPHTRYAALESLRRDIANLLTEQLTSHRSENKEALQKGLDIIRKETDMKSIDVVQLEEKFTQLEQRIAQLESSVEHVSRAASNVSVQVTGRKYTSSASQVAREVHIAGASASTSNVSNTQLVSPYELLAMGTKVKKKLVRSSEEYFQSRLDRLQDNVDRIIQTRLEATRTETEAVLQRSLDAIRSELDMKSKTIQQLEERQSLLNQKVLELESVTKRPLNALHTSQAHLCPGRNDIARKIDDLCTLECSPLTQQRSSRLWREFTENMMMPPSPDIHSTDFENDSIDSQSYSNAKDQEEIISELASLTSPVSSMISNDSPLRSPNPCSPVRSPSLCTPVRLPIPYSPVLPPIPCSPVRSPIPCFSVRSPIPCSPVRSPIPYSPVRSPIPCSPIISKSPFFPSPCSPVRPQSPFFPRPCTPVFSQNIYCPSPCPSVCSPSSCSPIAELEPNKAVDYYDKSAPSCSASQGHSLSQLAPQEDPSCDAFQQDAIHLLLSMDFPPDITLSANMKASLVVSDPPDEEFPDAYTRSCLVNSCTCQGAHPYAKPSDLERANHLEHSQLAASPPQPLSPSSIMGEIGCAEADSPLSSPGEPPLPNSPVSMAVVGPTPVTTSDPYAQESWNEHIGLEPDLVDTALRQSVPKWSPIGGLNRIALSPHDCLTTTVLQSSSDPPPTNGSPQVASFHMEPTSPMGGDSPVLDRYRPLELCPPCCESPQPSFPATPAGRITLRSPGLEPSDIESLILGTAASPQSSLAVDPKVVIAAQKLAAACTPLFQQALQELYMSCGDRWRGTLA